MKKIKRYVSLVVGLIIYSLSFNLFLQNYDLIPGGVSGIAIVFNKLYAFDTALFILILNFILIIVSYFTLGWSFTKNTILGAILSPFFIKITSFIPNIIDIKGTEVIFVAILGGILAGYGVGIIYKNGFSNGGTDVIEFTLSKYLKIPINKAIMIVDGLISIIGGLIFGLDKAIFSIIVLLCLSTVSNKLLSGINKSKTFLILSKKHNKIKDLLINEYDTDVTLLKVKGGKLNNDYKIIMTIIKNDKYDKVKKEIKEIDKKAFITITKSYEVYNSNKMLTKAKEC